MFIFILLALLGTSQGSLIPTIDYVEPVRTARQATQAASCNDLDKCRTLNGIIWSCLAVLFSCTWVSIHPNIPGPDETWLKVAWRRMGLMVGALVAPEFTVAWALRQRIAASLIAKEYKGTHGWTISHGFFVIMGGFMVFDNHTPVRTLLPDELGHMPQTGEIQFPQITEEEIQDKSKGDILTKGIVVLQTGWFVTQIVARKAQGISITELEVSTLAFAILSFIMYGLWWHKPLNVRRAARVYRKQVEDVDQIGVQWSAVQEEGFVGWESAGQGEGVGEGNGGGWAVFTWGFVSRLLGRVLDIESPFSWLDPFWNMIGLWVETYISKERGVGTFYAGGTDGEDWVVINGVVAGVGTVFGSIHLLGWSYPFPSNTERILWRLSALGITCLPAAIYAARVATRLPRFWSWDPVTYCILFLGSTLYVFFRVMLFVLPFVSLRTLPPDAYYTVSWITLIPHLH